MIGLLKNIVRQLHKLMRLNLSLKLLLMSNWPLKHRNFAIVCADGENQDAKKQGETFDQFLPEAFATVREAGRRVLGMRHFDVQLIGGMVLE